MCPVLRPHDEAAGCPGAGRSGNCCQIRRGVLQCVCASVAVLPAGLYQRLQQLPSVGSELRRQASHQMWWSVNNYSHSGLFGLFFLSGCFLIKNNKLTNGCCLYRQPTFGDQQGLRHRGGRGGRVPPFLRVRGIIPPCSGK